MPEMTDAYEWHGRTVVGSDGEKIGTISEVYVDAETGKPEWATVSSGLFGTKSTLDAGLFELAGVWSPGPVRHEGFEVIGGLRYLWAKVDFKLIPNNPALPSGKITVDKSYADFMLGARYIAKLTDRWDVTFRGDGSWGSTDGTYGAQVNFTYATDSGAWLLGYRYLKTSFSENVSSLDVKLYGPQFGYAFKF